ncbi:hypothetical protein AMELA_G00252780 [Ameiurus melas]|uniref:Uncharacterized protein n=1 Tax=Ameiurus melas TaxID=219545 RepID=A0A7J5ZQH2_AMEME|nr:hypothetical protein AMELA_G00252780 [Ameiurus melas]
MYYNQYAYSDSMFCQWHSLRGGVTDTLLRAEADIHLDSELYTTLTLQVCCIKLEDQEQLTFFSADSVKICSGGLDNTLTTFAIYSPHTSTHQQVFTDLKSLRNIVKISINQSIRHVHGELTERSLL